MIVLRLVGGLGNQLFQYCTGRAVATRLAAELVLDTGWFQGPFLTDTRRVFGLQSFRIKARLPTRRENAWLSLYSNPLLARVPFPRPWRYIREAHYHFDNRIESLPDNVYLSGYWQSEKYFLSIRDSLLEDLQPSQQAPDAWTAHLQTVTVAESVSMHIRRGDYVSRPTTAAYHGALPLSYYHDAARFVASRVRNPVFFVFSDDPDWVTDNLRLEHPMHVVTPFSTDPVWEMLLMSKCRHSVVANSSFSWWGAWLKTHPGSVTVAPMRWFGDPDRNTADLTPTAWHRL